MIVLVTGGAGFVGSHVVDALVEHGLSVRVLDRLHPRAHEGMPDYTNAGAEYLWGDLNDPEAVARAVGGVGAVCHQAAMVGLGVDFGDVEPYVEANDLGTASLLGALHRSGFSGRLALAGSMVVYGEGAYLCGRHGEVRPEPRDRERLDAGEFEPSCPQCGSEIAPIPLAEDAAVDPRNVYAATKLHQEHLCRAYAREHPGTTLSVLRYHNVYGPRMPRNTPYAGVASIFASTLHRGERPQVFEDGRQRRDFVHVSDIARANLLALTNREPFDGVANIASGTPHTIGEIAAILCGVITGDALAPEIVGGYRLGDVRHVFGATDRAAERLGFRARVDLDAGLAELTTPRSCVTSSRLPRESDASTHGGAG